MDDLLSVHSNSELRNILMNSRNSTVRSEPLLLLQLFSAVALIKSNNNSSLFIAKKQLTQRFELAPYSKTESHCAGRNNSEWRGSQKLFRHKFSAHIFELWQSFRYTVGAVKVQLFCKELPKPDLCHTAWNRTESFWNNSSRKTEQLFSPWMGTACSSSATCKLPSYPREWEGWGNGLGIDSA